MRGARDTETVKSAKDEAVRKHWGQISFCAKESNYILYTMECHWEFLRL